MLTSQPVLTEAPVPVLELVRDDRPAYRAYAVEVAGVRRLSSHFTRVTFAGPELRYFATHGLDQRIKLLLPREGADPLALVDDDDWYGVWRDLDDDARPVLRTYTVKAIRPQDAEIDVDFVVHGDEGPAGRWVLAARPGDRIAIVGPDARSSTSHVGMDWHPGAARTLLLAGDETAAPAICSILASLPAGVRAQAFIEVPAADDALEIDHRHSCIWLVRDGAEHGALLQTAVRTWVAGNRDAVLGAEGAHPLELDDVDVDEGLLWDSPEPVGDAGFYAWMAGEAATVKALRRHLVTETGVDRSRVAFMGYWRAGRSERQG